MKALDNLNSSGLLHRYIKPVNIILACKNSESALEVKTFEISPAYYTLKLIDMVIQIYDEPSG